MERLARLGALDLMVNLAALDHEERVVLKDLVDLVVNLDREERYPSTI